MSEKKYFCICEDNCKSETMNKEQILAAIQQAVSSGTITDVDTGFVSKVKERHAGKYITFWVGTTAQYNKLSSYDKDCIYIKADDSTGDDFEKALVEAKKAASEAVLAANQAAATLASLTTKSYKVDAIMQAGEKIESSMLLNKYASMPLVSIYNRVGCDTEGVFVSAAEPYQDEEGNWWMAYCLENKSDSKKYVHPVIMVMGMEI